MDCSSGSGTDRIRIPRIRCRCVLGVHPHERRRPRPVEISVTIEAALEDAAAADSLEGTVDYSAVARALREAVAATEFRLLEALARRAAEVVLELPRVVAVEVAVSKPGALRGAGAPEVLMRREKA